MNILEKFLNFIYPVKCLCCQKKGEILCLNCKNDINSEFVPKLLKIYDYYSNDSNLIFTPFEYKGNISKLIKNFKFKNKKQASVICADLIIKSFDFLPSFYNEILKYDFVTFVPMHCNKKNIRTYNQSEEIAKDFSKKIKIPLVNSLLKFKNNIDQKGLNRKQRHENVKNVYKIIYNVKKKLNNKSIILIDDVFTTGATFTECSNILKSCFLKKIICIAFCRAIINK